MIFFNRLRILLLLLMSWPVALYSQDESGAPISAPAGIRAPAEMVPITAPPGRVEVGGTPEDSPPGEETDEDSLSDSFIDAPHPALLSPAGITLKRETVSQRWDSSTAVWLDVQRERFSYDAAGLISESLTESMQASGWTPLRRTLTTRTALGLISVSLRQRWSGSDWWDSSRYLYSYDDDGRLLERVTQTSDGAAWRNMSRTVRAYDSLGRMVLSESYKGFRDQWMRGLRKLYSYSGSSALRNRIVTMRQAPDFSWASSSQSFYAFDTSGRLLARRSQVWSGTAWEDGSRAELSYTDRGYLAEEITWVLIAGEWWNRYRQSYTYHPDGKMSTATTLIGDGADWINESRSTYKFEENRTPARTIFERWIDGRWREVQEQYFRFDDEGRILEQRVRNDAGSGMENVWLTTTGYDAEGNQISVVEQRWDGAAWVNDSRVLTFWGGVTGIGESSLPAGRYSLGDNYPNPFNPATTITFTVEERGDVTLSIYDVLGREVATLIEGALDAGNHSIRWEAGGRPGGIYFVRLVAGKFQQTKRLVLLR